MAIPRRLPRCATRPQDILPLAQRFVERFARQYGKPAATLTETANRKLLQHPWKGNIRELEHVIEKAVIISDTASLPSEAFQLARATPTVQDAPASTLEDMERQMIGKALDTCNGNLSAVAAQLGITRQTLYNKMKKYNL